MLGHDVIEHLVEEVSVKGVMDGLGAGRRRNLLRILEPLGVGVLGACGG